MDGPGMDAGGAASGGPADAFWRDPPWRGGRTPFRMGLAEIVLADWLAEPIAVQERLRKQTLIRDNAASVLGEVPDTEPLRARVVGAIAHELSGRAAFAGRVDATARSLAEAALWVPEDLCVLAPSDSGYRLISACLCSPSYWRLGEKLGLPIDQVHAPVRGLTEAVGGYIERFLDRLPCGRVFRRRNWSIHQEDRLYHPEPEQWPEHLAADACTDLYMRSETQTLRRFDAGALLFTIRVQTLPLSGIHRYPGAVTDLQAAIGRMSAEERRSSGFHHHGAALQAYLGG